MTGWERFKGAVSGGSSKMVPAGTDISWKPQDKAQKVSHKGMKRTALGAL